MFWLELLVVVRLGRLWLMREASRLTSAMGVGTSFTAWGYGIVTGSFALAIALARGSTNALPVFLAGGIGMAAGAFFLVMLVTSGESVENRYAVEKQALSAFVLKSRAIRAQRMQRRREARAQAAIEAATRNAIEVLEEDEEEEEPDFVEVIGPINATAALGTCWYCKTPHRKRTQCPYCRMLVLAHH
jgi:hypothetical protein